MDEGRTKPADSRSVALIALRKDGHLSLVDIPGFVIDLKHHALEAGFHTHEEHHYLNITTGRQWWEFQMHPDYDCEGPLELHVVIDLDKRMQFAFEDAVETLPEDADLPMDGFDLQLAFNWRLPPLPNCPNLLQLATEISPIGGATLPLHVWALDTIATVTDKAARTVNVEASVGVPLALAHDDHDSIDETFRRVKDVTLYLYDRAPAWLGEASSEQ